MSLATGSQWRSTAASRQRTACVHQRLASGSSLHIAQAERSRAARRGRQATVACRAESKEYYDYKDMPPLPLTVQRIHVPQLGYTVVDKSCEPMRLASLAIFYDIHKDDQYQSRLTRKSAITALCMYDRDDVDEAQRQPGTFPNIDLLQRIYSEGLDVEFVVEEITP